MFFSLHRRSCILFANAGKSLVLGILGLWAALLNIGSSTQKGTIPPLLLVLSTYFAQAGFENVAALGKCFVRRRPRRKDDAWGTRLRKSVLRSEGPGVRATPGHPATRR